MNMSFSEFMKKSDSVLELYSLIESCLSKGMSIDRFTKLALTPVVERLNFNSEEEFVNQIKTKVSSLNEFMLPTAAQPQAPAAQTQPAQAQAPAPAAQTQPAQAQAPAAQPAAAQAQSDAKKQQEKFTSDTTTNMKNAIIKQLDVIIGNMQKTVDTRYKDKTQNFIAKSIGTNLLEKLKKALTAHQPKFVFKLNQKQPVATPQQTK